MTLDLTKYEGSSPSFTVDYDGPSLPILLCDSSIIALLKQEMTVPNMRLLRDAPALLAEVARLRAEPNEALIKLRALVDGLDATYWSSWQSTGHFSDALEAAREFLAKHNKA